MILQNDAEVRNTKEKLRELEEHFEKRRHDTDGDPRTHEMSMRSIKRIINQLKEQIARYEAHQSVRR